MSLPQTTLQDYLQQQVPDTGELCGLLARAAAALTEWQCAKGPHGGLTPAAFCVAKDSTVWLEPASPATNAFLGDTMAYLSPARIGAEAAGSQPCMQDDVYAMAVIAWESLTGVAPFAVSFLTPAEAGEVLRQAGSPEGLLPSGVPPRTERALRAALDPRAQRRPTAAALAAALRNAGPRRHACEWAVLAVLAVLAAGAAATALWLFLCSP
jgi:hypothetical protein